MHPRARDGLRSSAEHRFRPEAGVRSGPCDTLAQDEQRMCWTDRMSLVTLLEVALAAILSLTLQMQRGQGRCVRARRGRLVRTLHTDHSSYAGLGYYGASNGPWRRASGVSGAIGESGRSSARARVRGIRAQGATCRTSLPRVRPVSPRVCARPALPSGNTSSTSTSTSPASIRAAI